MRSLTAVCVLVPFLSLFSGFLFSLVSSDRSYGLLHGLPWFSVSAHWTCVFICVLIGYYALFSISLLYFSQFLDLSTG